MATCSYCRQMASANIPANPGRVCVTHAIEFWTAFLAFAARNRPEETESPNVPDPVPAPSRRRSKRTAGADDSGDVRRERRI